MSVSKTHIQHHTQLPPSPIFRWVFTAGLLGKERPGSHLGLHNRIEPLCLLVFWSILQEISTFLMD